MGTESAYRNPGSGAADGIPDRFLGVSLAGKRTVEARHADHNAVLLPDIGLPGYGPVRIVVRPVEYHGGSDPVFCSIPLPPAQNQDGEEKNRGKYLLHFRLAFSKKLDLKPSCSPQMR